MGIFQRVKSCSRTIAGRNNCEIPDIRQCTEPKEVPYVEKANSLGA